MPAAFAQNELSPFIPPLADRIKLVDPKSNDVVYPVNANNWWGLMNAQGNIILFPQFGWVDYAYDGVARAMVDGKTGYVSLNGAWYIDPTYEWADRFCDSYAIVKGENGKLGFINQRGRPITPFEFDEALRFSEGYAAFRVGELCGFINVAGKAVIKPAFARVRSFSSGLAMVQAPAGRDGRPGAIGYINKTAQVQFIDRSGKLLDLGQMLDGMARVKTKIDAGERWGYMNRNYKMAIEPQFEDARDFYNGLAAVRVDGRWGYIDKTGGWVVRPVFLEAWDFKDNQTLMIKTEAGYGYINRMGNVLIEPQFARAEPFYLNYARVYVDDAIGYLQISGRAVFNPLMFANGFVDARRVETIRASISDTEPYNRVAQLPPMREAQPSPYVPDYKYVPVLPGAEVQR